VKIRQRANERSHISRGGQESEALLFKGKPAKLAPRKGKSPIFSGRGDSRLHGIDDTPSDVDGVSARRDLRLPSVVLGTAVRVGAEAGQQRDGDVLRAVGFVFSVTALSSLHGSFLQRAPLFLFFWWQQLKVRKNSRSPVRQTSGSPWQQLLPRRLYPSSPFLLPTLK
jgi:hypothetical protein